PGSGAISRTEAPASPVFACTSLVSWGAICSIPEAKPELPLHPGLRGCRMQTRLRARTCVDSLEPRVDILEGGINFLPHAGAKIERAVKDDVAHGEALAGDKFPALEQAVQPFEIVLHGGLHAGGSLRDEPHTVLENLRTFRETEPIIKKFRNLKLDPPLPLARLGALLGRGADQRRGRMLFFEVLPDGNRFAETVAVIELERRQLPARLSVGIWGTAIFRFHQIDRL